MLLTQKVILLKLFRLTTDLNIIIYNIPYRTGRNIENDTIYKLAELKNMVALKDSCGDIKQTSNLLLNPPKEFSILTGEERLPLTKITNNLENRLDNVLFDK